MPGRNPFGNRKRPHARHDDAADLVAHAHRNHVARDALPARMPASKRLATMSVSVPSRANRRWGRVDCDGF